jgi:hypothetical protein
MDSFTVSIFIVAPCLALMMGGGALLLQRQAERRLDAAAYVAARRQRGDIRYGSQAAKPGLGVPSVEPSAPHAAFRRAPGHRTDVTGR